MRIIINNNSMVPIYEQVISQIKNEIIAGNLPEGQILPSVRALAAELKISALTVKKAYDMLEAEGFVTTVHGKGTFVNAADLQLAYEARRKAVEDDLANAIQQGISAGLSKDEIREIIGILMEELL
ncbi:MAG: GntR family transcriptional regulator [Erysipelotrichaceae bacterium]|nr:GntR family transcriptional regulator [Erysipelotrichaceae bacterium]MBR2826934.1 GntR family transcriptional regulator [Erysipelotrichaceae bacterium]